MSQISVKNLTFCYDGSFDNIFENVSFTIDTDWKLGFIGRNGKGKTTFLNILLNKYTYSGKISTSTEFEYFPYEIPEDMKEKSFSEFMYDYKKDCEEWRVICELDKLNADADILYRPYMNLSYGEKTKVLLAMLFSGNNSFLLIDEPTNHLDYESRECVKEYLRGKKGFILVSHDRELLDACIDHVLVLNRKSIEIQSGNFSSWWENKSRMDSFAINENEKHLREIKSLKASAERCDKWAEKGENRKIGFDPVKEHDRFIDTRGYIGAKTKKMQKHVLQYEKRISNEIQEKEGLLQDIENPVELKLNPIKYYKERLIYCKDISVKYKNDDKKILQDFTFELMQGERVVISGKNGSGKSTFINAILSQNGNDESKEIVISEGLVQVPSQLVISYINQDTSFLVGSISEFCKKRKLDESKLLMMLRQLDMERVQFTKKLEDFSEGQKKKVLIASSLITPAHLYIWDEPMNYIDVFTRMQIEALILKYKPTMILVEHDIYFQKKIATRYVKI